MSLSDSFFRVSAASLSSVLSSHTNRTTIVPTMKNALSPSSAETGSRAELTKELLEQSEQQALDEAAKTEKKVSEVKDLQRESIMKIINPKGSDGAASGGEDMNIPEQLSADIKKGIEKSDQERMAAIKSTPDAVVFTRSNEMAAYQEDGTGKVGIGHDAFRDLDQLEERSLHEGEHLVQEDGTPSAPLLKTDNPIIDAKAELDRGDSREDGAMKRQGGVSPNQTDDYKAIVKREDAMQKYLTANGENGVALSREAALTNEGFRRMHAAMIRATIRKNMEKALP